MVSTTLSGHHPILHFIARTSVKLLNSGVGHVAGHSAASCPYHSINSAVRRVPLIVSGTDSLKVESHGDGLDDLDTTVPEYKMPKVRTSILARASFINRFSAPMARTHKAIPGALERLLLTVAHRRCRKN